VKRWREGFCGIGLMKELVIVVIEGVWPKVMLLERCDEGFAVMVCLL